MKKFKKIFVVSCAIVMALAFTGCTKKEVYTIEPHETAFLISLSEGSGNQASFESEAMLAEAKVAAKQVYITYSKKHMAPTDIFGTWVPDNMLVIVNRTPVTREWSEGKESGTSTANQSISAESKESIGFSVGMNCSAQIYTENDAVKFLYSYNNKQLSEIMDTEIRARVEADFVEKCAKYTMNEILEKKAEIMEYVRKDVTEYFAERGITITVLGMKDGIEYDDTAVQSAINKSFVAERNAEAQEIENQTKISKANADAEAKIVEANAEAEANKVISESLTDRLIQQQMYGKWDGKLPTYVGGDSSIPVLNDMK